MATDFRPAKYLESVLRVGFDTEIDLIKTINASIQPDLLNGNKTINVRVLDDIELKTYTGADFTYSNAAFTLETFNLTESVYVAEQILRINLNNPAEAKDVLNKIASMTVDKNKRAFNTKICAHYADVDSDNVIYNDANFVTLTTANVWKYLNEFVIKFDSADVPTGMRHIIVPPEVIGLIQNSTNYSGVQGRINANIHMCNELSSTGSGTDKIWRILAYHPAFITGGFGINHIKMGEIEKDNVGWYLNALFNYDTTVFDSYDGYGWYMSAKVDLSA